MRVGETKGTENPAWSATATGASSFGCLGSAAVVGEPPVDGPNNDLIDDCENLLAANHTLRGTASLNWAVGIPMATWVRLILGSDRVTLAKLTKKSLTRTIPATLGRLVQPHATLAGRQRDQRLDPGRGGQPDMTPLTWPS